MNKFLALTTILVTSASAFAFKPNMTVPQVNVEVAQRVTAGESVQTIGAAAKAANLCTSVIQTSLIAAGMQPAAVFAALVDAGCDAAALLPPTAAGGTENAGNTTTGPGFNGFNASSFAPSRASTVGGGGRTSVSPS